MIVKAFSCLISIQGMCAAMIDIGSLWMFDLKLGVCVEQFWFNKEHCCWMSNESTFGMHDCGEVCNVLVLFVY